MTESTKGKQVTVGSRAFVQDPIPLLNNPLQVLDGPELPIRAGRLGTQQRTWRVGVLSLPQFLNLQSREHGSVPTLAMVFQTRHALPAILPTPSHQTGLATARNLSHLLGWVVGAIQSYRQKTGSRRTIFAVVMSIRQFSNLVFH